MEWKIDFDAHKGIVTVTIKGPLTVEVFGQYLTTGLADGRFQKGMPVLLDFRDADSCELSREDFESMAAMLESRSQAVGRTKAAVVVSTPRDHSRIKIWEVFASHLFASQDVFYSIDDALEYLRSPSDTVTGAPDAHPNAKD